MKITTVRYRRLESHSHGYGHDAFEAEALVEDGETPTEAMTALRVWVDGQITASRKLTDLRYAASRMELEVAEATRARDRLRTEAAEIRKTIRGSDDFIKLAREAGRDDLVELLDDGIPF